MPPQRLVVLGTGTHVGKTHVSVALCRTLAQRRRSVLGLKPIETGVVPDHPGEDALALWHASQTTGTPPPSPYVFVPPVSPHLAARQAGSEIHCGLLRDWVDSVCRAHPSTEHCLIESAGGVFSPLSPRLTNLDLAHALEPAFWILVAPDSLGVLHDVTATLAAMAAAGRSPDAIVLSAARPPDASTGTNAAELRALRIDDPVETLAPGHHGPLHSLADRIEALGPRAPAPAPSRL